LKIDVGLHAGAAGPSGAVLGRAWAVHAGPKLWDAGQSTTSGDQREQTHGDLLTVPQHEIGQDHEADGLMAQTLAAGTRHDPSSGGDLFDVAALDRVFADSRTSLAVPFADGPVP